MRKNLDICIAETKGLKYKMDEIYGENLARNMFSL